MICVYVLIYLLFQPFPRFGNSRPSEKKTQRHTMQKNSIKIQEIDSWQLQESDPVSDQDTWRLCCHLDSSWIVQSKEWSRNNKSPGGCDCICQSSICSFSWTLLLAVSSVSQQTEMTSLWVPRTDVGWLAVYTAAGPRRQGVATCRGWDEAGGVGFL